MKKMNNEDLLLRYKNNNYKLIVSDYNQGFIKVSMKNVDTDKITEITIDGVELVIPSPPTPNCALLIEDQDLIEVLKINNIIYNHYALFGQFNINELYKFDKKGVKAFIDKYASPITYRNDKGNSKKEIVKQIRKDSREVLNNPSLKDSMKNHCIEKIDFLFSILDNKNMKDSFAVFGDDEGSYIFKIYPYMKKIEHQFNVIPEYSYSVKDDFFGSLEDGSEIIQIQKNTHYWLLEELNNDFPNFDNKNGIKKYFQYCQDRGIYKNADFSKYKDIISLIKNANNENLER